MRKYNKTITLLFFVLLLSSGCGNNNEIPKTRNVEESKVYSALINKQLEDPLGYLSLGEPIVFINYSYFEDFEDDYLFSTIKSIDDETVEDFRKINQTSEMLSTSLTINKQYEYVPLPSDETGWLQFQENYPNVITIATLSKIGFNNKLDQALVYMAYYCGDECGLAKIYFLVRKGDLWDVKGSLDLWVR
ncbi:MAG: hypothetical protein J0M11_11815 [Anaerolineae bacterium]|nr:hypothetical protein [Anaerolineae bacterium]